MIFMQIEKLPTNSPLDKILEGGIEKDTITNIYGEPGSGKTNLAMLCAISAIKEGKNAMYIDTEGGFSLDRFSQLVKENVEEYLKKIILFSPVSWKEQCEIVEKIAENLEKENVGIIIIDSVVSLYRLEITQENFHEINRELGRQYLILSHISRNRNIPTLVTNQIYVIEGKIELTSRLIGKYWAKTLIKLEKLDISGHRRATIIKHRSIPEGRKIEFQITGNGLKEVGRFSVI